ncbi:hypothetical protein AcW1_008338 [Taiwanofungus camphoratus]|nr:hypothetical protein AcW1_008338 [Antrodia cinnamomea]KAI0956144.1 hypothetical protein AcV7_006621 [Antrodia cinnamomea]
MSFSSTPLGQGRRLDHHTFLNKPNSRDHNRPPHSPPRRTIPASYAYGAPTLGTRSPPKPDRPVLVDGDNSDDEPALVRFARLKQREQAEQSRLGARVGSRTITSPHPEKWSVKDTSVNIASAFNQAVDDVMPPTNPNDSWASGARKPVLPRSTSVEYEKETQSTINRRLAPPPSRTAARVPRPISKSASIRHVPDSEGEDNEVSHESSRGKSPFEHVMEMSRRLPPVAFLMRQRSQEPEDISQANGNASGESSYNYSAEEREYQAANGQRPTQRRTTAAHKRNRMSTDNKAYRPTVSDLEESDEDFEDDDGKRTRRKKKKSGGVGGPPLTSLPVAGYDKRKKRRKANGKVNGGGEGGEGEEDEDESGDSQEGVSEQRSHRGTTPVLHAPSLARGSKPPSSRSSVPPHSRTSVPRGSVPPLDHSSNIDTSMDIEQALGPIEESDENPLFDDFDRTARPSFSIGALLGRGVNGIFRLAWSIVQLLFGGLALILRLCGKVLGFTIDLLIHKPVQLVSHANPAPLVRFTKYAVIALTIYLAWHALNQGWLDLSSLPSLRPSSRTPYRAPDIPASDFGELSDRLQRLENALAKLSSDTEQSRVWHEGDTKSRSELVGRLGALESRVQKESLRAFDVETKFRATASEGLEAVRQEVQSLHAQIQAQRESESRSSPGPSSDEEARAKLRDLEERIGGVETGVREALELGKDAVKAGGSTGGAAAWWNRLASGNAGSAAITIKSTEGQDVTSLISHLVDSAVSRSSKQDDLARPDFALHSGGARVIPKLTSDTFVLHDASLLGQVTGFFTGNGIAIGRPPVTALHHETHIGHCWAFAGQKGQLGVALSGQTYITEVTIDHVAKQVAVDMRSAPRQMSLWGMVEGKDNVLKVKDWRTQQAARRDEARLEAELTGQPYVDEQEPTHVKTLSSGEWIRLVNFTYNIHAPDNVQTFQVPQDIRDLGIDFGIVVLLVDNNWGKDEFTCLYRLRVHGERAGEIPLPYPEDFA